MSGGNEALPGEAAAAGGAWFDTLRPARPDDMDGLLAIHAGAFGDGRLDPRPCFDLLGRGHAVGVVAEAGREMLGYALALSRPTTALARLHSLAVAPALRARGVGATLLGAAERTVQQAGARLLRLQVRPDNAAALALVQSGGYQRFERHLTPGARPAEALRFEKRLAAGPQPRVDLPVPYYAQTTDFTCGAAALLMAMKALDPATEMSRTQELRLWREATTIFMTSGHGGCDPYGMALAAHGRGLAARIFVSDPDILFLDGVRRPDKAAVMTLVQEDFRNRCAGAGIAVGHRALGLGEIGRLLAEGAVPIVLVSQYRGYGWKSPHWVVVTGCDEHSISLHDPYIAEDEMEDAAAKAAIPVPWAEFERMARYGRSRLRAAIVLSRRPAAP